jgi:hypothetical protein
MLRRKTANLVVAGALALGAPALTACDSEDHKDVEEITDEADKKLEDLRKDVDQQVDNLDEDGKDD